MLNLGSIESTIRSQWADRTAAAAKAASKFEVERYFGRLESWPRFSMLQERTVLEGISLFQEISSRSEDEYWIERVDISQSAAERETRPSHHF